MGWPAEELQIPETLRELILGKKCVPFLGSGLSAGSYDAWHDLINNLCEKCGSCNCVTRNSPTEAFLDAAQDAKEHNEDAYYEYLGDHFGKPANLASLLYDVLLSLRFKCYLTVNLDPLLKIKAIYASPPTTLSVYAYPSLDRKHMNNHSIHYLHGIIDEGVKPARDTIVLAREEFNDAYGNNSNLMNFLIPTLENEAMMFIGCRLKEPVMPRVFKICKKHQLNRQRVAAEQGRPTSTPPSRFILLAKPEVNDKNGKFNEERSKIEMDKQEAYCRDMDIEPVWYVANGTDHSALRFALNQIAGLPDVTPDHGWNGGLNGN